ncbi:MAG TPA: hypothetical protein VK154_00470 [Chitinophagales bacterium]|nr:hypothetical protein [Chitinophagales bacterium]
MYKIVVTLCLLACLHADAQDYLSGRLTNKYGECEILYDRTQNDISATVYQTVYKVASKSKKPLYTLIVTHDKTRSALLFTIKPADEASSGRTVYYDPEHCGLVFNDKNALDTVFSIANNYGHLVSFTDTSRTYPVLHKLRTYDNVQIVLDPLTKLRTKKHAEVVRAIARPGQESAFTAQLYTLRDSLYARNLFYHDAVNMIQKSIETDVAALMADKKVEKDIKRYEGEKRFGEPHGKGLLVLNGNIYSGVFKEGKFFSGNVVLKTADYEYCGQYSNGAMNGTGWIRYKSGSYQLGVFTNGVLATGVTLQKETNNEVYFGGYNGSRQGYGELQNSQGKYAGRFANGRLAKGYCKEVDPFGYYTYAQIENGIKAPVDPKTAEEFFGLALSAER